MGNVSTTPAGAGTYCLRRCFLNWSVRRRLSRYRALGSLAGDDCGQIPERRLATAAAVIHFAVPFLNIVLCLRSVPEFPRDRSHRCDPWLPEGRQIVSLAPGLIALSSQVYGRK